MSQTILDALADVEKSSQEQAASSQALTQEVAGKMAEIDQKVLEAEQRTDGAIAEVKAAIPTAVHDEMHQTVFVEPNGNDETGDGTHAKPFLTLKRAVDFLPARCFGFIRLEGWSPANPLVCIGSSINLKGRHLHIALDGQYTDDRQDIELRLGDGGRWFVGNGSVYLSYYSGLGGGNAGRLRIASNNMYLFYADSEASPSNFKLSGNVVLPSGMTVNVVGGNQYSACIACNVTLHTCNVLDNIDDGTPSEGVFNVLTKSTQASVLLARRYFSGGNGFSIGNVVETKLDSQVSLLS